MSQQLCIGQVPEYWTELGNDGNRLALAFCRACPNHVGCLTSGPSPDPHPAGVIRAAVAWSDTGKPLPICGTCGYPVHDYAGGTAVCRRCAVPDVPIPEPAAVRDRRVRLMAFEGWDDTQIAAALGIHPRTVQRARLRAGAKRYPRTRQIKTTGVAA